MYIGLTGPIASGKGTVAKYFINNGFSYFSLSQVVRDIATERNIPHERKNLQDLGNKLREENGVEYLANVVFKRITGKLIDYAVIDGIRNPGEVAELRKLYDFHLFAINASLESRFKRALSRNKKSDPKNWEDFLKANSRDLGEGEAETGQGVADCIKFSDYYLENNGSEEDLLKKVEDIYFSLKY
jgi:dephospho-CoA kinase